MGYNYLLKIANYLISLNSYLCLVYPYVLRDILTLIQVKAKLNLTNTIKLLPILIYCILFVSNTSAIQY